MESCSLALCMLWLLLFLVFQGLLVSLLFLVLVVTDSLLLFIVAVAFVVAFVVVVILRTINPEIEAESIKILVLSTIEPST